MELWQKSSILVSSDHMTFSHDFYGSSKWSLANLRQTVTCAGLSRGNFRAMHDFKPWRLSVLPTATLETVLSALYRSVTSSSHVVLGWFLTFLRIKKSVWNGSWDCYFFLVVLLFGLSEQFAWAVRVKDSQRPN